MAIRGRGLWLLVALCACLASTQEKVSFPQLFHKGKAQWEVGKRQEALGTLKRAFEAAPDGTSRAKAALALGRFSKEANSPQAAERWLRAAAESDPKGPAGQEAARELGTVATPEPEPRATGPTPTTSPSSAGRDSRAAGLALAIAAALGLGGAMGVGTGLLVKGRREGGTPRPLGVALLAGVALAALGPVLAIAILGSFQPEYSAFIPAGAFGIGILMAGWAHRMWVQGQLLKNTPVSRLRSAPQGWLKVQGSSTGQHHTHSRTGAIPCIHYSETTQEYRRHTRTEKDSQGRSKTVVTYSWDTVDTDSRSVAFDLDDTTGTAHVVPEKGEFHPKHSQQYYNGFPGGGSFSPSVGDRRTTVNYIPPVASLEIAGCLVSGEIRYDDFHCMLVVAEGSVSAGQWRRTLGGILAAAFGLGLLVVGGAALWEAKGLRRDSMDATTISVALAVMGAITLIWLLSVYNGMIGLKRQVRRAWADVDTLLKQRWDLVPNLVATVKGSAQHEQETLTRVAEARSQAQAATDLSTRIGAEVQLGRSLPTLVAVAEANPTLRAGTNFLALQRELSRLEESIADRREFYNNVATNDNTRICTFPGLLFRGALGSQEEPLFTAEGAERSVPGVSL